MLLLEFHLSVPEKYSLHNTGSREKTASPHMSSKQTKEIQYLTQKLMEKNTQILPHSNN